MRNMTSKRGDASSVWPVIINTVIGLERPEVKLLVILVITSKEFNYSFPYRNL